MYDTGYLILHVLAVLNVTNALNFEQSSNLYLLKTFVCICSSLDSWQASLQSCMRFGL